MVKAAKDLVIKADDSLATKVNKCFASKTPAHFIKERVGRGGGKFRYVEIGYVTNELNRVFGPFWEFKVADKGIGDRQIWIQGQLTIKDPKSGLTVTKENFGGVDIKYPTMVQKDENGKAVLNAYGKPKMVPNFAAPPIDIADDLKSSVADCTKKCASMFGVAADMFFKEQSQYDQMSPDVPVDENLEKSERESLVRKFFAICSERGMDGDAAKEKLKTAFGKEHMDEVSNAQVEHAIKLIQEKYEVVGKGNAPVKMNETKTYAAGTDNVHHMAIDPTPEVVERVIEAPPPPPGPMYLCQGTRHLTGRMEDQVPVPLGEFCSVECRQTYYPATPNLEEKLARWDTRRGGIRKLGGNA